MNVFTFLIHRVCTLQKKDDYVSNTDSQEVLIHVNIIADNILIPCLIYIFLNIETDKTYQYTLYWDVINIH